MLEAKDSPKNILVNLHPAPLSVSLEELMIQRHAAGVIYTQQRRQWLNLGRPGPQLYGQSHPEQQSDDVCG